MGELKALGIRNVPVTTVGEKVVVGFNREELTRLFGLSEKSERRAADRSFFATFDKILEALIRAARQVPPGKIDWRTPDRDRHRRAGDGPRDEIRSGRDDG